MILLEYFLKAERKLVAFSAFTSMLSGVAGAVLIGMIGQHLGGKEAPTLLMILIFTGLIVVVIASNLAAKWMLFRLTAQFTYSMERDLVDRVLATPFRHLEHIGSPRLLSMLTEDIRTIAQALNQAPTFFVNIAVVAGCLLYLLWLSPAAFLMLSVVAIPVYVIYRQLHKKAVRLLQRFFELRDLRFEHYEAVTKGVKELLMNARRRFNFIVKHFDKNLDALRQNLIDVRMAHAIANTWSQSAYFIFILVLFVLIMFNSVPGEIIGGYALVILYMRSSINQLLNVIPQWTQANGALKKIEELELSATPVNTESDQQHQHPGHKPLKVQVTGIEYRNRDETGEVTFQLGPVSMQFNSGEIVFIAGKNGSGKTTLLKLLTSLYSPEKGNLLLNDNVVNEKNVAWYRNHLSIIFTDYFLFKDLIDITDSVSHQQASDYISKLELDDKIIIEESTLSTLRLSHGQRKRLALLNAYMEDKPIYVFDEWAENQDPLFRETFYRKLLPELKEKGKLVIAVSHDDRYYDVADRVVYLQQGKLKETLDAQGKHQPIDTTKLP